MFALFPAMQFMQLCHKCILSNDIYSVEDLSCNTLPCDKNGRLLLFSFTAVAACMNILESLANWLIKYEGVWCITIFHRLHLALRFGCLIPVTETVKRTEWSTTVSKSLVWRDENGKWCSINLSILSTVFALRLFNSVLLDSVFSCCHN